MNEYKALKHKAAGHDGTLTDHEGLLIFKPLNDQELRFYQSIQNRISLSNDSDTDVDIEQSNDVPLESWMPAFLGVLNEGQHIENQNNVTVITDGSEIHLETNKNNNNNNNNNQSSKQMKKYLVLQNLLSGFDKPQVMDIKLGKLLYDDNATDEKKKRLQQVADTTTSGTLGFRICGMKIQRNKMTESLEKEHFEIHDDNDDVNSEISLPQNKDTKGYIFVNKLLGRTRTSENVIDAIKMFLSNDNLSKNRRQQLKEMFLNRLQLFFNTLLDEEVRMISSSLLFIYEGDSKRWDNKNDEDSILNNGFIDYDDDGDEEGEEQIENNENVPLSSMTLIDFAHSALTPGQGYDENVIEGVESLMDIFSKIQI